MTSTKWIVVNKSGTCRIVAKRPSLRSDEVPVLLNLNIPDSWFERPAVEANINVPEPNKDVTEVEITLRAGRGLEPEEDKFDIE